MAQAVAKKRPASYYREYRRRRKEAAEKARAADAAIPVASVPLTSASMQEACDWIETCLRVPTGPLAGRPFRVPPWQREWAVAAMGHDIREAGLSISRKNGKSGLIAAILCAFLVGPLNRPAWRGIVGSLTGNLAKELRDAVVQTLNSSGYLGDHQLLKSPPPGSIVGKGGAKVDFLAADRASGHALGADLAIIDEAGLLRENQRTLWNNIYTSISGRNGRLWAISIQGDGPMFEELEQRDGSPGVLWRKWAAPDDADIFSEEAWHLGNPGLADGIKSLDYMRDAARRAEGSPGNEMHFRAYDLNQPVDPERETIVGVREYAKCIQADAPGIAGEVVVGIDLGGTVSMTCAVAIAPETGAIMIRGAFGDDPPITERARTDRMGTLYDRMMREGELKLYPGRVTPVVPFLADFFGELADVATVAGIGMDRYRKSEAQQAFQDAGLPATNIKWRGTGAGKVADGSHDVRAFQRFVRTGKMATTGSSMLEAAIANSVIRYDEGGNPALLKAGDKARIDALSAAVIAAGLAETFDPAPLFRLSIV